MAHQLQKTNIIIHRNFLLNLNNVLRNRHSACPRNVVVHLKETQKTLKDLRLHIEKIKENSYIPFDLLELADPSRIRINEYLKTGTCYVAKDDSKVIGVLVLHPIDSTSIEIKNIAVDESEQGKGFGKELLRYSDLVSRELGFEKLVIGTGNSSLDQLALYQKEGFEMCAIQRDFFIKNYTDPIFENGIQCKHMVLLEKNLKMKNALQQRI